MLTKQWRAALYYAEHYGWQTFPLAPSSKKPFIKGGSGCKAATSDRDQLLEWAGQYPGANIGLATGPGSGVFVVDVDSQKGGDESLAALLQEHGPLPQSVEQATANGGRHILFRWHDEFHDVVQRELAPKIDLRVAGGYIVVAPSMLTGGREYRWDPAPWRQEVAEAPGWLVRLLPRREYGNMHTHKAVQPTKQRTTTDAFERARRYIATMPIAISGSGGHTATLRVALALVQGFLLNDDDAMVLLTEYSSRCEPPWSRRELEHKVETAKASTRVTPGWLLNAERRAA